MKQTHTKKTLTFSLDKELVLEFETLCDKNYINRSKLVEAFIREYVEKSKKTGIPNE